MTYFTVYTDLNSGNFPNDIECVRAARREKELHPLISRSAFEVLVWLVLCEFFFFFLLIDEEDQYHRNSKNIDLSGQLIYSDSLRTYFTLIYIRYTLFANT